MTTMMPEPKLFTKVETFRGVEMETIYRQGKNICNLIQQIKLIRCLRG